MSATAVGGLDLVMVGAAILIRMAAQSREQQRHREAERRRQEEYQEKLQRQTEERERQRLREEERQRQLEEKERQRRREEERQRSIERAWQQTRQVLQGEIDQVQSAPERQKLAAALEGMASSWLQAMRDNNVSAAEKAVLDLRQKIFSARTDEKMLESRNDDLSQLLEKLGSEAPSGFAPELEDLRRESAFDFSHLSVEERAKKIGKLKVRAHRLASEIAQANNLSLDDLEEEAVFIPEAPGGDASKDEDAATGVELVADICEFGERLAFFDEDEAERLRPLIHEARKGAAMERLKLIRRQIKAAYGRLRENAVLTDMFKRDLRDFLPPMRKAKGTEKLCQRMEELLLAPVVTREAYNGIYRDVKKVFEEQMEAITDALLAEKVECTLRQLGYELMDEEGKPVGLKAGEARLLSTPDENYRVRVKVGQDGTIATRLVRVVGSEEEKNASLSENQKQKDIEAGEKWCAHLKQFHEALAKEGLPVKDIFRREPGDEPLDVIVDASVRKSRKQTAGAERPQERLRERSSS